MPTTPSVLSERLPRRFDPSLYVAWARHAAAHAQCQASAASARGDHEGWQRMRSRARAFDKATAMLERDRQSGRSRLSVGAGFSALGDEMTAPTFREIAHTIRVGRVTCLVLAVLPVEPPLARAASGTEQVTLYQLDPDGCLTNETAQCRVSLDRTYAQVEELVTHYLRRRITEVAFDVEWLIPFEGQTAAPILVG